MCYYALSVFLACGHAVQGRTPIQGLNGCPIHRKESNRRSIETPSLTDSISTRPSPRTTISSINSYEPDAEPDHQRPETQCEEKLSHPLFTHRVCGLCETCWKASERRLADLDSAVTAEAQDTFIARAKREKTIFEGKRPRQLQLVAMREAEKQAERPAEQTPPSSPISIRDAASTMSYVRSFWTPAKGLPSSPRTPPSTAQKSPVEPMTPISASRSRPAKLPQDSIEEPAMEGG